MAATATAKLVVELDELDQTLRLPWTWDTTTTPTAYYKGRQTQATADTAEALELGTVSTPLLIVVRCVTNDVDIDCNYSSSFSADITVNEGECAVFTPAGTVYIQNDDAGEASVVEVFAVGT